MSPFMMPQENTLINYGYTKEQLFLTNQDTIIGLAHELDEYFEKMIKLEV